MWNPGGSSDERETNSCKINQHLERYISAAMISGIDGEEDDDTRMQDEDSRTELDSHANMPVVGRNACILSDTGRIAEVAPYTPDYEPMHLKIVDAAVKYESSYTGTIYMLVIRNALLVPAMKNNLIPPFMMEEAGVTVNTRPKIHVADPSVDDHSVYFPETKFRIPLSLWGVFSYFPTSEPTTKELQDSGEVYTLTPDRWDPHQSAYAENEDNMLDWEGNMVESRDRPKVLLSDIAENPAMAASVQIGSIEEQAIDRIMGSNSVVLEESEETKASINPVPRAADQASSILASISPLLDDHTLYAKLESRANLGRFQSAIGSTNVTDSDYLMDDDATQDTAPSTNFDLGEEQEELLRDILCAEALKGTLDLDDLMVSAAHASCSKGVNAEHLSKTWRIDLETAQRTIDITTQHSQRTDNPTLSRNYGTSDRMLRYRRIKEYFFMDTFFATSKAGKSSRGNSCCQLFVTDKGFVYVVPMRSKSDVLEAVKQFAKETGAPDAIISDAAAEQKSQKLRKFCSEIGTTLRILEEGTPWANKAELYIGLIKEAVRKDMRESDCPLAFWDYCVQRRARVNNLTAKPMFKLHGSNAHPALTGDEGDISNLCKYGWYEWCYFREHREGFPLQREILGRVLGPATGAGNEMCQWILKSNGNVVPRRSLRPLNVDELHNKDQARKEGIFERCIAEKWGTSINPPPPIPLDADCDWDTDHWEEYEDNDELARIIPDIEDTVDSRGRLLNQQPAYDKLINAQVQLQQGDDVTSGKVRARALDTEGSAIGTYDDNPMLNSMLYEVEFPDGQVKEYSANIIAENMLTQVDSDGFTMTLMDGVIDYRRDESTAVSRSDAYIVTKRGQKRLRKTTVGWQMLVKWKDQSESWIPLKDMKESHPVEVAEFATARGIENEPAFAWWVPYTLRKRDVILSAVKSRIQKATHKYGIEVPTSMKHAYQIDAQAGNTFWRDAVAKEMLNVGIAFEVLTEDRKAPVGWKKVTGHLVWDVKMDFTRKARWVLDGHLTPDIIGSTYA